MLIDVDVHASKRSALARTPFGRAVIDAYDAMVAQPGRQQVFEQLMGRMSPPVAQANNAVEQWPPFTEHYRMVKRPLFAAAPSATSTFSARTKGFGLLCGPQGEL